MRIALVANGAWYLVNFRRGLIQKLIDQGHDVVCICPQDGYLPGLIELGVSWKQWDLSRRGMNPLVERRAIRRLAAIYRELRPDVVHHFTIKCVLYGTRAARSAGVGRIVNGVTGLGHLFTTNSLKNRLLRPWIRRWYRASLVGDNVTAMFQNHDDMDLLFHGKQPPTDVVFTAGSGVDLEQFRPQAGSNPEGHVFFAGRLIREKGIFELVEASRIIKQQLPSTEFTVCGDLDQGNPSSISPAQLDEWKQEGVIHFTGHVSDLAEPMGTASIVVLPSYREGLPRVLLEAAALGKPLVATDVAGCREIVEHGVNGLLVASADAKALAEAVIELLQDKPRRDRMGERSRAIVEEKFDEQLVIEQHLAVYDRPGRQGTA